ncbi:MAG TPA: hypothetical protein VM537_27645, partial [Anaerolineae bacterium]|nr:hypothetical protein [Anaerolineae bacterium]
RPEVDLDDWGQVYSLWADETQEQVFFATRPAGGPCSGNVAVRDVAGSGASTARMATDRAGNAHAVWVDLRNGNSDIYGAFRPAGGPWSSNVRVNDDATAQGQAAPEVMVDAAGNAFAVWLDAREQTAAIYGATRYLGWGWGPNEEFIAGTVVAVGGSEGTAIEQADGGDGTAAGDLGLELLMPQAFVSYPRPFSQGSAGRGFSYSQATNLMDPDSPWSVRVAGVPGAGSDGCNGVAASLLSGQQGGSALALADGPGNDRCRGTAGQQSAANGDESNLPGDPATLEANMRALLDKIEQDEYTWSPEKADWAHVEPRTLLNEVSRESLAMDDDVPSWFTHGSSPLQDAKPQSMVQLNYLYSQVQHAAQVVRG